MPHSDGPVSLVVAVVTYRRPRSLAVTAAGVLAQQLADGVAMELLVVDNDPDGSARQVAEEYHARYVLEPRPGLAAVRNAALDAAAGADLLQFVDDDEEPGDGWLSAMCRSWQQHRSTAVVGPVSRQLPGGAEPWVVASGFFDRSARPDGALMSGANTGNLLLDLDQVRHLGLRFDERFGLSGGEDTMFAKTLLARGGSIRWCASGVVVEPQPADRATRSWVLARARRTGNSWSRVHLVLAGPGARGAARRTWLSAHAVMIAGRGAGRALVGVARRRLPDRAGGRCELAKARGVLAGAWGRTVLEYVRS